MTIDDPHLDGQRSAKPLVPPRDSYGPEDSSGTADADVLELWALDRIEDVAEPYHDWLPEDEPVLNQGIELDIGIDEVTIFRDGEVAGQMRGERWSAVLAEHLQGRRTTGAGDLAEQLSIPFPQLAEALLLLERLGVVRTALAEWCSLRAAP